MKYVVTLTVGFVIGAALAALAVLFNPFVDENILSPLSVTDEKTIVLSYSDVPTDSVLLTNHGQRRVPPYPGDVAELWEKPIRQSEAFVTVLRDARGRVAGFGVKFSSLSERTRLLNGEALVDSVWYLYLPQHGNLFVEQSENYWSYLRDIVLPAYRSGSDTWRGNWVGNITAGPGALHTANVSAGRSPYAALNMVGLETLTVRAWSVEDGPVAAEGRLIIELPSVATPEAPSAE